MDLIDMRHEPSGQFKWILHIKDYFLKYSQLYSLKTSMQSQLQKRLINLLLHSYPKIMQADNGKEFKGAISILLRKYGIQLVNGAPRSPL